MAETQREPVPRVDSGEFDTALAFLSFARHCVLKKADGPSEEQLRRVVVESGTYARQVFLVERYVYDLAGTLTSAAGSCGVA
jgi:hypothetical protein